MRIFVFVLMIVLLPLRGWAGEAMATEMAANQMVRAHKAHVAHESKAEVEAEADADSATYFVASDAHIHLATAGFSSENQVDHLEKSPSDANSTHASGMPDCDGHANAGGSDASDAHCDACPACQACHTVALPAGAATLNLAYSAQALLSPAAVRFASAAASQGQKPPIS